MKTHLTAKSALVIPTILLASNGFGAVVNQVGSFNSWPDNWTVLGGYDTDNGLADHLDFVGDVSNPGLYYATTSSYVFFRLRVDADTFSSTPRDAHLLLIDMAGYGTTGIDYAFAWDSKSNNNASHGLEMSVAAKNGPTWGVSQLDDIDNSDGQKLANDINGAGRSTDGYVRTVDTQPTIHFGNTTFVDFAVSWSYLETYTNLRKNQQWNVAFASIANATDHNAFNADVSSASLNDSISLGWTTVPEPGSGLLLGLAGGLGLLWRRRP